MSESTKESKTFATKRTSSASEMGASGTANFVGIIDTQEYKTELKGQTLYTTIDQMRWSDASIQAAILMCELPIRSAEWDIEPASESKEDQEIAEFVKDQIFNGLTMPWEDTLRQILLMHPYGCMVFEVVYKLTNDGKIGWRKWAPRLPRTLYKWNINAEGELESITQQVYKDKNFITVDIPFEKLMVFVNRREGDNYLGTSILRQAYKHWFYRDRYYQIDAVAQERHGIGIPMVTLPDGFSPQDKTDAEDMGKNLRGHEKAFIVKKTGWEVEMMDLKTGTLKDPMPMLEHHTGEILKSVLAQFIELGSKGVGSYSLSKDQSQIFLSALDASAKVIEDAINKEIKKLVDYNWNVELYPKITHSDLGSKDFSELSKTIQAFVSSKVITPDPELESYLRKGLKLPELAEDITPASEFDQQTKAQGLENMKNLASQDPTVINPNTGKPNPKGPQNNPKQPDKNNPAPQKPSKTTKASERQLTKFEKNVRFDEISDFMDKEEANLITRMSSILQSERAKLIPIFEDAIRRQDFADLNRIAMQLKGQYSSLFREQIKKLFEYGKLKASYEIKQPAPFTDVEMSKEMTQRALSLANRQELELLNNLKGVAAVAMMDRNLTNEEALKQVEDGFNKFISRNVPATAAYIVTGEINEGRKFTFDSFKDDLYGYQWSAILDGGECNYCKSMDGRTIGVDDKAFSEYRPGEVHFHCRCIWVGITKEEDNPPPFTGVPNGLPSQAEVPPWEFKDLAVPVPGAGGRAMPYGIGVYKEHNCGHNR